MTAPSHTKEYVADQNRPEITRCSRCKKYQPRELFIDEGKIYKTCNVCRTYLKRPDNALRRREYMRAHYPYYNNALKQQRRQNPNHPCHFYPDELITTSCEKMIAARITQGKTDVDRGDIYVEIVCSDGLYRQSPVTSTDHKRYIKGLITTYMNARFPLLVDRTKRKVWDISSRVNLASSSGGEPCPATTADCLTTR